MVSMIEEKAKLKIEPLILANGRLGFKTSNHPLLQASIQIDIQYNKIFKDLMILNQGPLIVINKTFNIIIKEQ